MKNFTLLLVNFLVLSFYSYAHEINVQQAKKVALNFYFEKYNQFEGLVMYDQLAIQSVYTETDGIQNFYYVFSINKGGFVMVPADDCLTPVLGYSFKQNFVAENQPPNVKYWFSQYKDQVLYAIENKLQPNEARLADWNHYATDEFKPMKKDRDAVEPLLTTLWDQGYPYNCMCPTGAGGQAVTGCVATAYVQLLYYWRFPLHGSGYHCYDHPVYGELCADFENTWYRWDEMCDAPQTNNTAIGELMFHLGVALEMDYGVNGSGSMGYPEDVEPYFNISTDYDSVRRDYYTDPEWRSMILEQLDQAYPIPYVGYTSNMSVGHFWVCDGYQDTTYYHMNWGWGGLSNGYYTLDNLQGFNTFQYIGINFYPDTVNFNYPFYESGADTLTYFEGSITDGSGPVNDYLNNTTASWLIDPQTEDDSVSGINLMVKRLDLFDDGDKLCIYDGENNLAPIMAELTGNTIPDILVSSGNKVFIEFTTNNANRAAGFYLNYYAKVPDFCPTQEIITDSIKRISDGSGRFSYKNGTTCMWFLQPEGCDSSLTLYFNYFDTEADHDYLKIFDLETEEALAEYSGFYPEPPPPVTSPSGSMLLIFYTNNSVRADGWSAFYGDFTGIEESLTATDLQVYPNPIDNELWVSFTSPSPKHTIISLYSITGEECMSVDYGILPPASHNLLLNTTGLAQGIYFLRLQAGNEVVTKKVVKM